MRRETAPGEPANGAGFLGIILLSLALLGIPVAAPASEIVAITLNPAHDTLRAPEPVFAPARDIQYVAWAWMSDGTFEDITDRASWTSRDPDFATFNDEIQGLLRTRKPGVALLEARIARTTGRAKVSVDPGEAVELITRPGTKKIELDRPAPFSARIVYESGYQEDVTEDSQWSSSNPAVARVDDTDTIGLVIPSRLGTTLIRAHHPASGLTNTDGETVVLPPIDKIRFKDSMVVLGRGMSIDLPVVGYHGETETSSRITSNLEFSTEADSIIDLVTTGKNAGRVEALQDGFAAIRAYDRTRNHGTGPKNAVVVVVGGVLEDLEVLPNPFVLNAGDTRKASVYGILSSGLKTQNLRKLVEWLVEDPTRATVENSENGTGTVTGENQGKTTLMARYEKFDLVSTTVDNLVVRGRVIDLTLEPADLTIGIGLEYPLRAYANREDGGRSNIANKALWSTDGNSAIEVDGEGVVTALGNGVAIVTAVDPKTGFEASLEVTVAGHLMSLRVKKASVELGEEKKAKAIGTLSGGLETSDLRPILDWEVFDETLARVGNGEPSPPGERRLDRGEILGLELGTTTLRARDPRSGIRSREIGNLRVKPIEVEDED